MKTSSFGLATAAALTIASLSSATAGGWIVSGQPHFVQPANMVAPSGNWTAGRFGSFGQSGFHGWWGHGSPFFPGGFAGSFNRFGPLGQPGFRNGFGQGALFFPGGFVGGTGPYPSEAGPPPASASIWAPINLTVVTAPADCVDGYPRAASGGPKIITFSEPPRQSSEKLPVVIYGTQPRRGC